jgi:lipopolysaccharide/colanic/teichoic acid biosynthesis glycosyltransferase
MNATQHDWRRAKRLVDIVAATAALVFLGPILVVIGLVVRLDSPGPAIYRSRRMTADGRSFVLYKFRTMYRGSSPVYAADGSMIVAAVDPRVTRVGRILRHGLDELPQFVNVLQGHMSVVGPRADPPEAAGSYQAADWERLAMKPGITGLAQVSGRTDIPLERRRDLDRRYVASWCPRLDFYVCLLTLFELVPGLGRAARRLRAQLVQSMAGLVGQEVR